MHENSNQNKESSHLNYWDLNIFYGWAMSQKLPVNDCKQIEDISEYDEIFIKSYNGECDEGHIFEVDTKNHEIYITFTITYPFCQKE